MSHTSSLFRMPSLVLSTCSPVLKFMRCALLLW